LGNPLTYSEIGDRNGTNGVAGQIGTFTGAKSRRNHARRPKCSGSALCAPCSPDYQDPGKAEGDDIVDSAAPFSSADHSAFET
jgi:hypothetical protein